MEKQPQIEVEVRPTLVDLDNFSGREIEGIESKPEKFVRLEEGTDYEAVEENDRITSSHDFRDFIVFISPSTGTETKMVEAPHWRSINDSGVRSSIEVEDHQGRVYTEYFYAVSTKGIGYLKPTAKDLNIEDYDSWAVKDKEGVNDRGYKVLGLISKEEAEGGALLENSEYLMCAGLRTELYWGMAELKRLPFKGQMLTVDELRDRKVISPKKDYKPYEVVRLFKMNNRIAEAAQSGERREELFKQAFDVFNQETRDKNLDLPEISIGNPEEEPVFFQEFFKRMGQNMATFFNLGYDHGYMHSANVTLAAEIADVGTMGPWQDDVDKEKTKKYSGVPRSYLKDMRDMCYGLRLLIRAGKDAGLNTGKREALADSFLDGFNGLFDSTKVSSNKIDATNAKEWMEKILDTVIVKKENLLPLLHNEVEDWHISV
ncbi:MAG: hypothetical protein V4690_01745 [Patescibacteria group bacterium]